MGVSLQERMERLGIREPDLEESFVLGSGPGGQKINKTASCVHLRHRPTGIEVHCQESRSREANRDLARLRLCERIEDQQRARALAIARKRARKRFANRRESPAQKAKRLKSKRLRSEKKRSRGRVSRDRD